MADLEFDELWHLLTDPLVPAPASTEFKWSPQSDFARRGCGGGRQHVAELYHVNSKLRRSHLAAMPSFEQMRQMRELVRLNESGVSDGAAGDGSPRMAHDELAGDVRALLQFFASPRGAELLYSLDIFLLDESGLHHQVPGRSALMTTGPCRPQARPLVEQGPAILVVGQPWRYMALEGPRGYRSMLLDAGRVLGALENTSLSPGASLTTYSLFVDDEVERSLGFDGLERTTLAIAQLVPGQ